MNNARDPLASRLRTPTVATTGLEHAHPHSTYRTIYDRFIYTAPPWILIMLSERADNDGMSVINCIEELATKTLASLRIQPYAVLWLEHLSVGYHYAMEPGGRARDRLYAQDAIPETVSMVNMTWTFDGRGKLWRASNAKWVHLWNYEYPDSISADYAGMVEWLLGRTNSMKWVMEGGLAPKEQEHEPAEPVREPFFDD